MAADKSYGPKTYRKNGGDIFVVADGGSIVVESGGTLEMESGAIATLSDEILAGADVALAYGSILVGDSGGAGSALNAKGDGKILVGNGTTITSVSVSGDVTLTNNGEILIAADKVGATELGVTAGTAAASKAVVLDSGAALSAAGAWTFTGATPLAFTGSVTKGLNFNGVTPVYTSQENAYLAIGTYTVPVVVADNNASFIPIQVNLSSTASAGAAGNQVAAARFRVDSDTNAQANTAIHCLQLRSDIGTDVYAAACISASLNVSAAVAMPTATMQGIYIAITGAGAITCPNNVNVLEAVYKQTSGGSGVDNVAELACNAASCSLTNILDIHHYAGTLTNGINFAGTMTTGINLAATSTTGIAISGTVTTGIALTSTSTTGISISSGSTTSISAATQAVWTGAPVANGLVYVNATATSTTPGSVRAIHGSVVQAATTTTGTVVGVRGSVTGTTALSNYAYGAQGKVILDSVVVTAGSNHVCGVMAQISGSSATFTSGHIAGLIVSGQTLPASSNVDMIYVETGGANINSAIKFNCRSNYLFDINNFESCGIVAAAGTGSGSAGQSGGFAATRVLVVYVDGAAAYIPLCSTNA